MARRPRAPTPERRAPPAPPAPPVRIQKRLADAGLGSRRAIEGWIAEGRVRVNGRVAQLGDRVTDRDVVQVDGRHVRLGESASGSGLPRVLIYHKPAGEVCTRSDPEGRPTVYDALPPAGRGRWIGVGRLDVTTSGLLLFTDDGELANRLMHPSHAIEREYAVRLRGELDGATAERLLAGVELEDGPARFLDIREGGGTGANQWVHVVLCEGRNREVRRLFESQGLDVSRLIRVRFGPLGLPEPCGPAGSPRSSAPR